MPNRYWSDTHFDHSAAIEVFARPFASVEEMNRVMEDALVRAVRPDLAGLDLEPDHVFHLGDFAIGARRYLEGPGRRLLDLEARDRLTLVCGNHDVTAGPSSRVFQTLFGQIVGKERSFESNTLIVEDEVDGHPVLVLLSHVHQRHLQGCDFNLYGHIHDGFQKNPDWLYQPGNEHLARSIRTGPWINVSVELIGYRPRTLAELLHMRKTQELDLL
jgi:calcineurin-like phosphoesterase family protein